MNITIRNKLSLVNYLCLPIPKNYFELRTNDVHVITTLYKMDDIAKLFLIGHITTNVHCDISVETNVKKLLKFHEV